MGYDMYRLGPNGDSTLDDPVPAQFLDGAYFRLNIWGMSEVRDELEQFGIVRESVMPTEWPDKNDPEFEQKARAVLASTNGDGPGICVHKLCSNDGWIVTPLEVSSGVGYADANHPGWREQLSEHAREFVEWAEGSDAGFEVW